MGIEVAQKRRVALITSTQDLVSQLVLNYHPQKTRQKNYKNLLLRKGKVKNQLKKTHFQEPL